MNTWLAIILSAVSFNLAFFSPTTLGFLIVASLLLLTIFFRRLKIKDFFGWSILIYFPHFIWLYTLLLTKSNASFLLATAIYFGVSTYFVCLTILFFVLIRVFFRSIIILVGSVVLYFYIIEKYSLWFIDKISGYPFINPLIPLVCFLSGPNLESKNYSKETLSSETFNVIELFVDGERYELYHLRPVKTFCHGKSKSINDYSQKIYQNLCALDLYNKQNGVKKIVLAPESTFPFPLNKNQEQLDLWSLALPKDTNFLLGSCRLEQGKTYQTVYFTRNGLIINFYDKTHLVPFVEKVSKKYNDWPWIKSLFLKRGFSFNRSKREEFSGVSNVIGHKIIIPRICSEFFFCFNNLVGHNKLIILFVNDSWFASYFRRLMYGLVKLRSLQAKVPVIYVGHSDFFYY